MPTQNVYWQNFVLIVTTLFCKKKQPELMIGIHIEAQPWERSAHEGNCVTVLIL